MEKQEERLFCPSRLPGYSIIYCPPPMASQRILPFVWGEEKETFFKKPQPKVIWSLGKETHIQITTNTTELDLKVDFFCRSRRKNILIPTAL